MTKPVTIFAVVVLLYWIVILGAVDKFQFSVPFLMGSLTIIGSSVLALFMGLFASKIEPVKAVGWISGGLSLEMFIPLTLVICIKFVPDLLVNSKDLVIILKYFLAFFPVCLILEKALVLREFHLNHSTNNTK